MRLAGRLKKLEQAEGMDMSDAPLFYTYYENKKEDGSLHSRLGIIQGTDFVLFREDDETEEAFIARVEARRSK